MTAKTKADRTRARLLRAGERLFAEQGIEDTTVAEITRAAGQRNGAAVHYHFGGRDGLLDAILDTHHRELDALRHERMAALEAAGGRPSVRELLALVIDTMATRLTTPSGRAFLQIQAHRSERSGGQLLEPSVSMSVLRAQLRAVLPASASATERERADLVAAMVIGRLARRAREKVDGRTDIDDVVMVTVLVDAATAVLTASISADPSLPPDPPTPIPDRNHS